MIIEHYTQAQIAKTLGIGKSLVSYHVKKAIVHGYVKEIGRDRIKLLELTQRGTNFLDQYGYENKYKNRTSNRQQLPIIRAENIRFKARVLKLPRVHLDWKKVAMNNWSQHNGIVDDIKVHLNNGKVPSIEFIPSPVDGSNPWELVGILYYDCNEVARRLEQTLDMGIGRLEIESRPEWVVYDPVANIISRYNGQITVDGLGKINASKPLRRGEIEFFDPRYAVDHLTMPKRMSNIEKLLEDLLKICRKEYSGIKSEEQIDKVQDVEQNATDVEQVDNNDCNSDEEES